MMLKYTVVTYVILLFGNMYERKTTINLSYNNLPTFEPEMGCNTFLNV